MVLPEAGPKDGQTSKASDQEDRDFDPSAEALIDEMDDERTLEEEEALAGGSGGAKVQEELDDLKKESEMPIEELLAYYERMRNESQGGDDLQNSDEEDDMEDEDDEDDGEQEDDQEDDDEDERRGRKGPPGAGANSGQADSNQSSGFSAQPNSQQQNEQNYAPDRHPQNNSEHSQNSTFRHRSYLTNPNLITNMAHSSTEPTLEADSNKQSTCNHLEENRTTQDASDEPSACGASAERHKHSIRDFILGDDTNRMFKTLLGYDLDDSDDEDYSYTDDENSDDERGWRRAIHVGPEFQAEVPESLCEYDDLPPYENEDKLVWKCNPNLTYDQILDYLKRASALSKRNDISISPASVPKISSDSLRIYREKMLDMTSSASSRITEPNHENTNVEPTTESLTDKYMSQSRKRVKIDYEIEQENVIEDVNHGPNQNQVSSSKEDDADSISQDARPELSTEEYFQDEEQLLYLLLQCNYNFDEAMRRRNIDPFKYYLYEPMTLWSQEECLGFEHGLRIYGKDFRSVRENKVPTRTHAEVVTFYYLWKKSERHDVYTNQYKLDRKRSLSHPGTTDYMDKFIEDNQSALNASSSSTPTPTDSTVGTNQTLDIADASNAVSICHSTNTRTSPIQCIDLSQETLFEEMNQVSKDDENSQNNGQVYIGSNTII